MSTGPFLRCPARLPAFALICLLPVIEAAAAETRDANRPAEQPQALSLSLDTFVRSVLINHPELEVAEPSAQRPAAEGSRTSRLGPLPEIVVWSAPTAGGDVTKLRERVNSVLYQAIEAYWEQVRRLEEVKLRERALTEAQATARNAQGQSDEQAGDVPVRTAETALAEARIALHRTQLDADAGADRLKLLMNDEALPVETETKLVLTEDASEPPRSDDLDLDGGIHTALRNRLAGREDRRDRAARRRYEAIVFELKAALRQAADARVMLLLAKDRQTAAQKALEAADRIEETRKPTGTAHLLARLGSHEAFADAERQLATAKVDYQIALAAWYRATGELNDNWRIGVEVRP